MVQKKSKILGGTMYIMNKKYFVTFVNVDGLNKAEDSVFIQTSLNKKKEIENALEKKLKRIIIISQITEIKDNSPMAIVQSMQL